MKILLASLLLGWPAAASAQGLLVGAVRDQDGDVLRNVPVTGYDAAGAVVSRDRTAADGTFALDETRPIASVEVKAPDADPLRLPVRDQQQPLVAIVRRHRAADLAPSPADVAALPAGALTSIASTVPYYVTFPGAISYGYLAHGRGVVLIEDLPFYRQYDGADASALLPSHATGALVVRPPSDALWYGDHADGGIVDAQLFNRTDDARVTDRDVALRAGGTAQGFVSRSFDPDGVRSVVGARDAFTLGGNLSGDVVALAGDAPGQNYAGIGGELHAALRATDLTAHVGITRDTADAASGAVSSLALDARGRGTNAVAVGLRIRDEHSMVTGVTASHEDSALVAGITRGTSMQVKATVALAYGRDKNIDGANSGVALLPALALDAPLGRGWSVHSAVTAATLGTPGIAIARTTVAQTAFDYTDGHRFRGEVQAYSEHDDDPYGGTRGIGASLGWEFAPRLSLRSWIVGAGDESEREQQLFPGGPYELQYVDRSLHRGLVWLTWDASTRVDLLVRNGGIEGAIRIPLGRGINLVAGSYRYPSGIRTLSMGVTLPRY